MKHLVLYIIFLLTAFCSKASTHWSIAGSDGRLWQSGKFVTDIEGNILLACDDVYYNFYYTNWALVGMKRVIETDVVSGRTIAVHDTYGAIDLLGNVIVDFKYKNPKRVYADKAWKNRCKDAQLGTKYADMIRRAESAMEKHAVRAMVYKIGTARAASVENGGCKIEDKHLLAGKINGKYGVLDDFYNVVIDFAYDDMYYGKIDNHFVPVKQQRNANWNLLDYCGTTVWQNFATKITGYYYIVGGHHWIRHVSPKDNKGHYSDYDPHVKVVDFIKH